MTSSYPIHETTHLPEIANQQKVVTVAPADDDATLTPVPSGGGEIDISRSEGRRYRPLDLATFMTTERPPVDWVVTGMIPAGTSVSIVAPAGVGKSLFALALGIDIALGTSERTGLSIEHARRVFLVDMESRDVDLAERLESFGVDAQTAALLEDKLNILLLPDIAGLDTETGRRDLDQLLDENDLSAGDVLILDSLQRLTRGDENDSGTYRDFYRNVGVVLKRREVTVIRTDNTGKNQSDGSARGSSGKRDDVDIEYRMQVAREDPYILRFDVGKARGLGIEGFCLLRQVEDGRTRFSPCDTSVGPVGVEDVKDLAQRARGLGLAGCGYRPIREGLMKSGVNVTEKLAKKIAAELKDQEDDEPSSSDDLMT